MSQALEISKKGYIFSAAAIKNLTAEFGLYLISTAFLQATRLIVYILAAKILGPENYGIWSIMVLIVMYGGCLHLGVINGMNREVPYYKGKNDPANVVSIKNASFSAVVITTVAGSIMLLLTAEFIDVAPQVRTALRLTTLCLLIQQFYQFFLVYLKSDCRFNLVSLQQIIAAGSLFLIGVPLLMKFGLNGLIWGHILSFLIAGVLIFSLGRFADFRLAVDTRQWIRLAKIGFPIMAVGITYSLLTTVDRWVILKFLGTTHLGYYALAGIVFSSVMLLPSVIADQVYPRMAHKYGKTQSVLALKPMLVKQIIAATAVSAAAVIVLYVSVPFLIKQFLPGYIPGIRASQIILLGLIFVPAAFSFGGFLNVLNRQIHYLVVQVLAIFINMGLSISFVKAGYGIEGVAVSSVITYVTYTFLLAALSCLEIRRGQSAPA
jgi:O-antigen/teichoic acid export membrane protein